MDRAPEKYAPQSEAEVLDLVRRHPFAWVVSAGEGFSATPLPLRPALDESGRLTALIGHFGRSNPQIERLRAVPRALILFMGEHGYVSPSWMADRTQAPTWNYASAVFECEVTFTETSDETQALLADLIGAMEAGRPRAWTMAEMGERAARLARGVTGFRADILAQRATFKLGQDERDDVFTDILAGLREEGRQDLADLMARHGADHAQ